MALASLAFREPGGKGKDQKGPDDYKAWGFTKNDGDDLAAAFDNFVKEEVKVI